MKRRVVFVCRSARGESAKSARALKDLDGVVLLGICEEPCDGIFEDQIQVANVHDTAQLIHAAETLTSKHGTLNHFVTAQETLLDPVARTREALAISGMSSDTVRRALDKSLLKATLRQAGVVVARDQIATSAEGIRNFVSEVGFPIMLKPLTGSGALATLLIRDAAALDQALELMQPSLDHPVLAEVYLRGQELCIDTITIAGEPRLYSICCYYPSILEALDQPETQWSCVMPREIEQYREFIHAGLAAVKALSVGHSITHMEGFIDSEGRVLGFTDATLRPAGARIGPMLGFAHDVDPYRAWARVVVDGCFDGPWERKYAVGTIFLRGLGSGVVKDVAGIDGVKRDLEKLVVDASWPRVGMTKSETYTGDGYVTVRHEETEQVKDAIEFIKESVKIGYSGPALALEWSERFRNYGKLNRPAWEVVGSK